MEGQDTTSEQTFPAKPPAFYDAERMLAAQDVEPDTEQSDPWLEQAHRDAVAQVSAWLRRPSGSLEVLSLTSWDSNSSGTREPSSAFNVVIRELDLEAAIDRLPQLEQVCCLVSKAIDRETKGWFRTQVIPAMERLCGMEWIEWTYWVESHPERDHEGRENNKPFERLLSRAAEHIVDDLGDSFFR